MDKDLRKARKRQLERERYARKKEYIKSRSNATFYVVDGERYTLSALARKSYAFIDYALDQSNDFVYHTNSYLCVAWANAANMDSFDFASFLNTVMHYPTDSLVRMIYDRYRQAKRAPLEGSGDMKGFHLFFTSRSKKECLQFFHRAENRGYAYAVDMKTGGKRLYNTRDSEVVRLCLSKEFTAHGLATLIYAVMGSVKNLEAITMYENMYVWLQMEGCPLLDVLFPYQ